MHFAFSDEDQTFRREVRDFYEQELPADWYGGYDERDAMHEFIRSVRKKMADRQWLTMAWPKEYGGQDAPITRQLIFAEESAYYRFNARDQGVGFLGPAIWMHGTEEQKERFLGPISRADVAFHQGFSEPDAGSDLAGLRTQARRDGDDFVINGQKIWGGHLHLADYSFLLARTDPDAPKHKGPASATRSSATSPAASRTSSTTTTAASTPGNASSARKTRAGTSPPPS